MKQRAIALLTAAGLAAGLLTGCGIPDSTGVRVDGPGPRSGSTGGVQPGSDAVPPKRKVAVDNETLVRNFLMAAAGDADGLGDRINDYLATGVRDQIDLSAGVSVVHLLSVQPTAGDGTAFTLKVRHLGTLQPDGELWPAAPDATDTYLMRVGEVDDRRELYVLRPPPIVLMTDEALNKYYNERTIYFWNHSHTSLVPDLRYLPLEVPAARMPTEVLGWLVKGPSRALGEFAEGLPTGTKLVGTAPLEGDSLTTSWSPEAAHDEIGAKRLAMQIAWSLWHAPFERLDLRINGQQPRPYDAAGLRSSADYYSVSPTPERFAIYEGAVRALVPPTGDPTPEVPLASEVNRNLISVAIIRGPKVAVAASVDTPAGPRLQVGSGDGVVTALKQTTVEPVGRPVWLPGVGGGANQPIGLVADSQGHVYRFQADGKTSRMRLPVPEAVTDIAVSPDGHRLAVIAGGKLYLVLIATDKATVTPAGVNAPALSLSDLTAVAWLSETHVAVVGRGQGRGAQFGDVSIDGGVQSLRAESTPGEVRMLSAVPEVPVYDTHDDTLMFQAGNRAARARGAVQMIEAGDVAGVAGPASAAPDAPVPSAPFYVY
jgi:hypothetical protein